MLGCHDPRPTTLVLHHPSITRYSGHTAIIQAYPCEEHKDWWLLQPLISCQDPHPIQPLYYTSPLTRCWARCHPPVTTPVRNTRLGGSYQPLWASRAYTLQPLYSISPLTRFRARCYPPVTSSLRYTKLGGSYSPYQPTLSPSNPCIPHPLSHAIGYAAIL